MSPSPTIQRYADTLLELFQQELYAAVSQQSASRTTPCSPVHAIGHDDQEALSAQIDAQTRRIHELEQSLQDRDDSQTAANLDPLISDLLRSKRIFGALGLLTSDNEEFLFNEDAASILRNLSLPNPEHASPQSTWSSHTFLEALKSVSDQNSNAYNAVCRKLALEKTENDSLRSQHAELTSQLDDLRTSKFAHDTLLQTEKNQVVALTRQLKSVAESNAQACSDLHERIGELTRSSTVETTSLQEALETEKAQNQSLQAQLDELNNLRPSYNTLLSMHRKDQDRLLELTQEIPRLRSSHAEELSTLQKLIESMTKSAAADATAKQVLEQEAASAKNLAQEHTELRSQLRQLQQQLSSEKSQRMKLQVESATRSNNNKARVDELEKQLAECQTAKAAVEADLTKERKRAENEKGKGSRLKPPSRTIDLSIDDDIQVVEPSSSSSGRELSFRPNNTSNNIAPHQPTPPPSTTSLSNSSSDNSPGRTKRKYPASEKSNETLGKKPSHSTTTSSTTSLPVSKKPKRTPIDPSTEVLVISDSDEPPSPARSKKR